MKGWVVVFSDNLAVTVELRRLVLHENGIAAIVLNKRDSSYLFGSVELWVQETDAERAMEFIRNTSV